MIIKNITLDTYERFFYDTIKVNHANNTIQPYHTTIFYRIEQGNFIITFEYMGFCINVIVSQSEIDDGYLSLYPYCDDENIDNLIPVPDKTTWFIEKYCDNRGIETLN